MFSLDPNFVKSYKSLKPPFGFNGLGEFVYRRTYSRLKADGNNEEWYETVERVINGTYRMQERHIKQNDLGWSESRAQKSAQEMYDRMYHMKFLPPGRGLWAMGSEITENKNLQASLFNCSFVSTKDIAKKQTSCFRYLMDMSMLGVGVGFDTKGAGKITLTEPQGELTFVIPDSREGWVESLKLALEQYFISGPKVTFDYSLIRAKGVPLKGFGGVSAGYEPLKSLHDELNRLLSKDIGQKISSENIVDIMNLIGVCVVSGNLRRSALIAFGEPDDENYLTLKDYYWNGTEMVGSRVDRASRGWTSNNSVFAKIGMDYSKLSEQTFVNGEPGYIWLENVHSYGRLVDGFDNGDNLAEASNPCFSGDTLIAVADGRGAVPIKELAETDKDVPVYSINPDGIVEIKWGRHPRITRKNTQLVRITLDDNSYLDVTPDHKMVLLDGTKCEAKDLVYGDSLPRFTKRVTSIDDKSLVKYIQVHCDTTNHRNKRTFEHRVISKFYYPDAWEELYNPDTNSGWVEGNIAVHHKDGNGLNNDPLNLEVLTFSKHTYEHLASKLGEENPMWGKEHKESTKQLIGDKAKARLKDPEYYEKWYNSIFTEENRKEMSERQKIQIREQWQEYYLERESETDLETVWIGTRLHVVKQCETCKKELILPWSKRENAFCSISCANSKPEGVKSRQVGMKITYAEKQRKSLHEQVMVYKDLQDTLGRSPYSKEWHTECSKRGVAHRPRGEKNLQTDNPYAIKSFGHLQEIAKDYNHRVKSVEYLSGTQDVYNITVDDNHTVGIVTTFDKATGRAGGVFTPNCGEIALSSYEGCNLVETFPFNATDLEDYKRTLKFAYLYSKTVTLSKTHWPEANKIMLKNRRIGCSMSGIQQFISKYGLNTFKQWCEEGYSVLKYWDNIYSDWFCIPKSIRISTVKPAGTTSLVAGATPGMHWPEFSMYARRVRLAYNSKLIPALKKAGYPIEPDVNDPHNTLVVTFPVKVGDNIKSVGEISIWEQTAMSAFMQKYWSDNLVSCTVSFDPETEEKQIRAVLDTYQYQLKGVSFLPKPKSGAYQQMPYEAITEDQYNEMVSKLKPLDFSGTIEEVIETEKFCNNDTCTI